MTLFWRKVTFIIGSLLFVLLGCAAAAQSPAAPTPSVAPATRKLPPAAGHRHGVSKPSPVPTPPQPPPPPPTPEQMPPAPPQVAYSNGLLTIVANNSTLSDILRAVSARTGATVDAPPQLGAERVAAHIGPGTPRDVLSDLLSGPGFDYILLGSDGDPNSVRSIILTPNQSSPSASAVGAQRQPVRAVTPPQEETDDELAGEPQFQPETPPPAQPAPPPQQIFGPQPPYGQQLPPDQTGEPQPSFRGGRQPQIKTPEQLLEELRKMQQQGNQP